MTLPESCWWNRKVCLRTFCRENTLAFDSFGSDAAVLACLVIWMMGAGGMKKTHLLFKWKEFNSYSNYPIVRLRSWFCAKFCPSWSVWSLKMEWLRIRLANMEISKLWSLCLRKSAKNWAARSLFSFSSKQPEKESWLIWSGRDGWVSTRVNHVG